MSKMKRYRSNPSPKVHNAMVACEKYDHRAYKKLEHVLREYYEKWWDGPKKNRDTKSWKKHRNQQYHVIPHFDLFEPFERDECGVVITDEQLDQMQYLLEHYEFSAVAELVYA